MNLKPGMSGSGRVDRPEDGAIEYPKNPMEEMVEQDPKSDLQKIAEIVDIKDSDVSDAMDAAGEAVAESSDDAPEVINFDENVPIEEIMPESEKDGFDPSEIQDARYDSAEEGGVTKPSTTGPMKLPSGDVATEGGQIKPRGPLSDSTANSYELSGFHVEVRTSSGMVSQQVTQDFGDIETAKACVNGETYLMPVQGGVKACKITRGAPIICFNERQLLEYVGGVWRKP